MRVEVKPELLRWAAARNGRDLDDYSGRFPKIAAWATGDKQPTLKQLEGFARATHTPIGFLFLPEPPVEKVPIPDLRTMRNDRPTQPSPDLLDTIYLCQQRQEWYRNYARTIGDEPFAFVGSLKPSDDVVAAAEKIRTALGFDLEARRKLPTWTDALRLFIGQADALGVLVMVNGVVGSNNTRRLDPEEFRGFALVDDLAPLVFINGADTKAAQMFSLAHELAHLWLGATALSNAGAALWPSDKAEQWCNQVAAELLVPLAVMSVEFNPRANRATEAKRLARLFKVSTLVVLRRIHDAGGMTRDEFWREYEFEIQRLSAFKRGEGGDFYLTLGARVGKRFARALVASTWEGQETFTHAFRLLGFKKMSTFKELGASLGMLV